MSRRNGTSAQVLLATAVCGLFVYGLYSHHDIQTRLKKSDEKGERLRQQHDSLSAQLQVVYEHKSRLEKSLQAEKAEHRKSRTELSQQATEAQTKFENEKQELLNRINSINQEHRMMKSQHEDLQVELVKVKEEKLKVEEDHRKLGEQHNIEFQQMQQEKLNEISQYRDQVANLQRKNEDLENRLAVAVQNYQLNQNDLQKALNFVDRLRRQNGILEAEIQRQKAFIADHQQKAQQQQQLQQQQHQDLLNQQNQQHPNQQFQQNQPQPNQQFQQNQQSFAGQNNNFNANNDNNNNNNVGLQQQGQQPSNNGGQFNQQQQGGLQQQQQQNQGFNNNINSMNNGLQQDTNLGVANVVNRQIPQNVQNQFNNNQNNNQGGQQQPQGGHFGAVQDMAIQHQNMGLQQQQQQQQQQDQQQQQQQQGQQQQQQQQQQGEQQQPGGEGGLNDPQSQNNGQEQAMQIRVPGEVKHPGYHEVKKPDPPQEGQINDAAQEQDSRGGGEGGNAPAQNDAEHKDVQFQQVAAPNMSPEKGPALLLQRLRQDVAGATDNPDDPRMIKKKHLEGPLGNEGHIEGGITAKGGLAGLATDKPLGGVADNNVQGRVLAINAPDSGKADKTRVVNEETGQNPPHLRDEKSAQKEQDQDKAMEEHDPKEDEANQMQNNEDNNMQLNVPKVHRGGLNHFEGAGGANDGNRQVIQAPVNQPQEGAGDQGAGHGQMERPNVVPPMVNNNQENQVALPQAPQLRNNELLNNGQQVVDDTDYDNAKNNDNQAQQDDQEEEDDDNYQADKARK